MEAEAMAALGWSSLPVDIVNRVADSLLATNDLDCYAALRAVCHHWRAVTADPASNSQDPRFRPTQWIMLDEHKLSFSSSSDAAAADDTCLFVNTSTGRFLRKSVPFRHGYHLVTSTVGGFVILADRRPPHAARVLNPFTGCMIRFKAPVPSELAMTANVVAEGDLLVLVLAPCGQHARDGHGLKFYVADPDSEHFFLRTSCPSTSSSNSNAVPSRSCMDLLRSSPLHRAQLLVPSPGVEVVAGEILLVTRYRQGQGQGVCLFKTKMNSAGTGMALGERVTNIGSRALFVGPNRCFSVDAANFPSIDANCAYLHSAENIIGADSSPVPILQLLMEYTYPPHCFYKPAFDDILHKICELVC